MPRLPAALEPAFPQLKRVHRLGTRRVGAVTRAVARRSPGERRLPYVGTSTSAATVALEPDIARIHPGAPAERVVRTPPVGEPADHWYFRDLTDVTFMPRYTLEIEGGVVVGNYAAHLTPSGVLDYQTSHYFGIRGWHEHPIFLRPRLPEITHVDGTLLSLATRGSFMNYYHVLMDELERYAVFAESMPGVRPDALLVNTNTRFAREYLALLGLDSSRCIDATKHVALSADRLLAPSLPNVDNLAPPWTTQWLRDHLPARRTTGRPRRVYVTRGDKPNSRRVTNERELLDVLRPLGFEVFDPGAHSVQDQIDTFAAAEVVVGPHGAGLTNLVFAPAGVRILELFAPRYLNPGYWAIASNLPDATYRYLVGEPADTRPAGSPMTYVYDDIVVDVPRFRRCVADLLASDPDAAHPQSGEPS